VKGKKESSFCKQKEANKLYSFGGVWFDRAAQGSKSFLLLFFKKEDPSFPECRA
jgi:hypothetical protein